MQTLVALSTPTTEAELIATSPSHPPTKLTPRTTRTQNSHSVYKTSN